MRHSSGCKQRLLRSDLDLLHNKTGCKDGSLREGVCGCCSLMRALEIGLKRLKQILACKECNCQALDRGKWFVEIS